MTVDILRRRMRSAPPQQRVRRLVLADADYQLFEAIDRHGPLPSHYLYEFTRQLRRDQTHLQNRLTEFYNGDAGGPYLARPQQQFASFQGRYQHVVYDLARRARGILAERNKLTPSSVIRCDPFVHRLMSACVGAAFELSAPQHGLRYISFQSILKHSSCNAGKASGNALALPLGTIGKEAIIPDLVFGLEYPGAGFKFFAVEIDRNTESIERRNLSQSAFARKLLAYETALATQSFRAWWGIPNLHVLIVTTSAAHADSILRYAAARVSPACQRKIAITTALDFGANWRVPKSPMWSLLSEHWRTTTGVSKKLFCP